MTSGYTQGQSLVCRAIAAAGAREPWGPVWPDNVEKTGVSPGGQSGSPTVTAEAEQVERTRGKTWSRVRSRFLCPTGLWLPGQRPNLNECTLQAQRESWLNGLWERRRGLASPALGSTAERIACGDGALSAGAPARDLVGPRWMGSVPRAGTEPGQKRCSAESSERSSLATTPEPWRDWLGSLPTPHPRFPSPSIPKIGDLLAASQTHGAESVTLFDQWPREISGVGVAWPM